MVGGNLPNKVRYFYEGISIRALFSWGQCRPCVVCEAKLEEVLKEF
jgi:hypothetical protein